MICGSNTTEAHPIVGLKVKQAVKEGAKLVVIDPRVTEVAALAKESGGIHLQIRPGSNIPLLNSMLHIILEEGLYNEEFVKERTENMEAVKEHVKEYPPERVAEAAGVEPELIRKAAELYATADKSLILYGLGVAEHKGGTHGVMALANLVLATGNVGKPHAGINPLRGQNNVQGACDMGTLPYTFPGYQPTDDEKVLKKFAQAWGVDSLSATDGLLEPQMYDQALEGKFKALYVVGYDPAQTQSNIHYVHKALEAMDFIVVQDMFMTETAKFAHLVLPSACFYEKDGTFTSGERRVRRIRKCVEPPGDAKADWKIVCAVAKAMGYTMEYSHPKEIMEEIASLTPQYAGISYERLEQGWQIWPCPSKDHPGTPLLHTESFPIGKGHFVPVQYILPEEEADKNYPLVLITGRILEHYNNGSMTRRSAGFDKIAPEEMVEVNPVDAETYGLVDRGLALVESRRGKVKARVKVTERSQPGSVFMTFHYESTLTNFLTSHGMDVKTLTPEYKVCAVKLSPAKENNG